MKPETTKKTKHNLTDKERDNCLKLLTCGLRIEEVAEICGVSRASVGYIRQAHIACINKDWSTLQRLSCHFRPTVDWAMKVTGTDKVFLETFPKDEPAEEAPETESVPETINPENLYLMYQALKDIRSLLTEIRDTLNEIK